MRTFILLMALSSSLVAGPRERLESQMGCICNEMHSLSMRIEEDQDIAERMQFHDITYARMIFKRIAWYECRRCALQQRYCELCCWRSNLTDEEE